MKKYLSLFLTMVMFIAVLTVPEKAKAAVATLDPNGANAITLQGKEIARVPMDITVGGVLTFSVSAPEKSNIWISVVNPAQDIIMKDSGNWVQNQLTGLYDLNISADVFPGTYTVVLENSDDKELSYTLNSTLTGAPVLGNGVKTDFEFVGRGNRLYCIEAPFDGYFNIKIPSGNPLNLDSYLLDATGKQIDDDDTNPDWNTLKGSMNWNTINVKKGTYYLRLSSGLDYYTSNITVSLKIPSTKVKLNKTKITLKKKKTFKIKAKLTPSNSTDAFKYKSSNKKVATVSKSGKITAKKKGKAVVTVTATSGKKAKIKVTVK